MKTKHILPNSITVISIAVAFIAIILLIHQTNNSSRLLKYKTVNDQKYVPVLIHTSQMIWLYNGKDYCLISFKGTGDKKATYKYRFYDGKLKKEIKGNGEVSEELKTTRGRQHLAGEHKVTAETFNLMWSPRGNKELFYLYVIPDKFDLRILIDENFENYPYYNNK